MSTKNKVVVWGHRGSPKKEIENTVPSFLQAAQDGADGIELDVYMTSDDQVIVFHDSTLTRLAGVEESPRMLTLSELKSVELRVDGLKPGRIPTLEEVLDALPADFQVNIEIKGGTAEPDGVEAAVLDLVNRYGGPGRFVISSFNPVRLRTTRRIEPNIRTAFIHSGDLRVFPNNTMVRIAGKVSGLHPNFNLVDDDFITAAKTLNRYVNAWTPNEETQMQRLIDIGVDWITTDCPDILRKLVG